MYRFIIAIFAAFLFFSCNSDSSGPDLSVRNKFFPDKNESYNVQHTGLNSEISFGKLETKYYKTMPWEVGSPPIASVVKNLKTYNLHYTTGNFDLSYVITDLENKYYIGYEFSDTVHIIGYLSEEHFMSTEVVLGDTLLTGTFFNRDGKTTFMVGIKSLEESYPAKVIYDENFGYFEYIPEYEGD